MSLFSLRRVVVLGSFTVATMAIACSGGDATGSTCPSNSTLTYDSFGKNFFQTNCLRCHSSTSKKQSPTFDTVEAIRARRADIDKEAAAGPNSVNDDMPDDGDISEAERRKLGEWLACGAP
jgi:hypothetical protein